MPGEVRVLSVDVQGGTPCLWALVEPEQAVKVHEFRLIGTGHPIYIDPINMRFIGTFQLHDGRIIFHLFEITEGGE
jgi:hypothetical protein